MFIIVITNFIVLNIAPTSITSNNGSGNPTVQQMHKQYTDHVYNPDTSDLTLKAVFPFFILL